MDFTDTALTKLLNIKYPVLQGGMAWVSDAALAAAVSNAGGAGIIAAGNAPAEWLTAEIRKCRALTNKPFGVNLMLMAPGIDKAAAAVIAEKPAFVTTGAGSPQKYIEGLKAAGIKVLCVVPSVALAKRMERLGCDAVIAEGGESGGHIGEHNTMSLVPQVRRAVSVPVVAAGGIADGAGMAAAFCLGACGVQCGTVFLASAECTIHQNYKDMVINAGDLSTVVTGRSTGLPVRSIKNALSRKLSELEKQGVSAEELENLTIGSLRKAVKDGDLENGSFMAGQIAGLIGEVKTCRAIIEDMVRGAAETISSLARFKGNAAFRFLS